ncbi:MAG: translation initiation factor IF-2 [Thermoprotei archaeon]
MSGQLMKKYGVKLEVPGLLFVDTPGHEAFVNLRIRGGSIADIAIVVVDAEKGLENQTIESIKILKEKKTPFLVAMNKIDRIPGWVPHPELDVINSIDRQHAKVKAAVETLFYRLVNDLNQLGFTAERFDRVRDFRSVLSIVPVSAVTGEGIPELLLVTAGLCQVFLRKRLQVNPNETKGVVLEVKEEQGLGYTLDAIIYDGVLKKNDNIIIMGVDEPIVTKVKALLLPRQQAFTSGTERFREISEAHAAIGVKIVATNLEGVIAGSPIYVASDPMRINELKAKLIQEVESIKIKTDSKGVIVKADTLGTLEALVDSLKKNNIPIRLADIGNVSKRDLLEASISRKEDPLYGVILAFNVRFLPGIEEETKTLGVPVFKSQIIYELIDGYLKWLEEEKNRLLRLELASVVRPAKIKVIPSYVFRRSNPIIIGVEILSGSIKAGYPLISDKGVKVGEIMQIQYNGQPVSQAARGQSVAISIKSDVTFGRQLKEDDILYVAIPYDHIVLLKTKYHDTLSDDERETLDEYARIIGP